jgi:hypothetical protein
MAKRMAGLWKWAFNSIAPQIRQVLICREISSLSGNDLRLEFFNEFA